MSVSVASGFNTYVPSFDATGHLVVAYSRNPKDFPLNQWATVTPVKKSNGYFLQVTAEQAARIINSDLADFVWPDSGDAPSGIWGMESFNFQPYNTTRFAFPFRLGYKANEQADWKILALHSAFVAQQAMTGRAVRMINAATTTGNYPSSNVATAKNWQNALGVPVANQVFLNAGTTTNPAAKNTLNSMAQQIILNVNGAVKRGDFVVILNPNSAAQLAASSEIQDYLKNSPFALAQVRGDVASQNGMWGLPDVLYGYKLIIDDTVRVTSRKAAASRASAFAFPNNELLMGVRVGGLVSEAGGPSFSTWHMFMYEEMTVEQRDDPDNRRITARVVEDYDVQVVAPATGAVCSNLFS